MADRRGPEAAVEAISGSDPVARPTGFHRHLRWPAPPRSIACRGATIGSPAPL